MALTPFLNYLGQPQWDAILEMSTLHSCIHWNRQDLAQQVLAQLGNSQIRRWQYDLTTSFPPYAVYVIDNFIVVDVVATSNLSQALGDINLIPRTRYPNQPCNVHPFFFDVWNEIKFDIVASMPIAAQNYQQVYLGHSMGGAVAYAGALEAVRNYGRGAVWYMSFGQPKLLTSGLAQARPSQELFISGVADPITKLPPNNTLLALQITTAGVAALAAPSNWQQYPPGYQIDAAGNLRGPLAQSTWDEPAVIGAYSGYQSDHVWPGYLRKIFTHFGAN